MKLYIHILLFLILCGEANVSAYGYFPRPEPIKVYVSLGETTRLLASANSIIYQKLRGTLQWQYMTEDLYRNNRVYGWKNLANETADSLVFAKTVYNDGYYRSYTVEGTCDTLFSDVFNVNSDIIVEGEDFIERSGDSWNYKWREDIALSVSDTSIKPGSPIQNFTCSNKYYLIVPIDTAHKGNFSITFTIHNLYPSKYKLRFQSLKHSKTGLIGIKFNGEYLAFDDANNVTSSPSRPYYFHKTNGFSTYWYDRPITDQTGDYHLPIDTRIGINYTQWYVSATKQEDAEITLIYEGPGINASGKQTEGGLVMDYIGLLPVAE